ncbi:MAG TPA: methyltransferase domain-containing protein [Patescibacteria group bacterium]|nr:methyltransferase domain-containing protein [Patescibacteria group bacterium]
MTHAGSALLDPHAVFEKIALAPGMRVADLGCGRTGHFVFPASRVVGEQGVVYAVDVVKSILESIRSRARSEAYDNVQTVWSNIELPGGTPIPPETLDNCFFVNVLFLVDDKRGALAEGARLLKKGGRLVVVVWESNLGLVGPTKQQMVDKAAVSELLTQLGLVEEDAFAMGEHHYCLIFKK